MVLWSALRVSVIVKHYSVCGALLSRVEDPLFGAIRAGDVVRVRKLVNLPGCNMMSSIKPGWLPIHQAANHGQEECLRVLLTGNTNTRSLVDLLKNTL